MTVIDRRSFLRRAGLGAAGIAALSGPLGSIVARAAFASGSTGLAANNGGYGPLGPVPDLSDGLVRMHLPEGFSYRSFAATGSHAIDGTVTPGRHDGMAVFPWRNGTYRLVRNHEVNGPGPAFGERRKAYDQMARGGTYTIEVTPHAESFTSWVSLNGTQMNCAGGETPWGSWISGEETVNGPDVGNDFTGGDNSLLTRKHGYIFDVPVSLDPGEYRKAVPIRSAGRFAHEAVAVDPSDGIVYMTEDNFGSPSGFYRYIAPRNPVQHGRLLDGGRLEMLAVAGRPNAILDRGQTPGVTYGAEWVVIDDPDPDFAPGTTNNQAINAVGDQGRAKGAATFSRLEGIFYSQDKVYLVSTQGGDTPPGETPPRGYGDGFGQLWVYDIPAATLTLLFESPSREVLELPDNMTISPRGSSLLCEDGPVENYLRGINPDGEIFDFALNAVSGREGDEFAGSTFTPDGEVLFVNIQSSSGLTFAIWGPWENGPL